MVAAVSAQDRVAAYRDDRVVHAECRGFQVVRYERAGKWYVEPHDHDHPREHVGVVEAARRALAAEHLGGTIYLELGRGTFRRWIEVERAR